MVFYIMAQRTIKWCYASGAPLNKTPFNGAPLYKTPFNGSPLYKTPIYRAQNAKIYSVSQECRSTLRWSSMGN